MYNHKRHQFEMYNDYKYIEYCVKSFDRDIKQEIKNCLYSYFKVHIANPNYYQKIVNTTINNFDKHKLKFKLLIGYLGTVKLLITNFEINLFKDNTCKINLYNNGDLEMYYNHPFDFETDFHEFQKLEYDIKTIRNNYKLEYKNKSKKYFELVEKNTVVKIQRQFRESMSNPKYKMCRDRLMREFNEL